MEGDKKKKKRESDATDSEIVLFRGEKAHCEGVRLVVVVRVDVATIEVHVVRVVATVLCGRPVVAVRTLVAIGVAGSGEEPNHRYRRRQPLTLYHLREPLGAIEGKTYTPRPETTWVAYTHNRSRHQSGGKTRNTSSGRWAAAPDITHYGRHQSLRDYGIHTLVRAGCHSRALL